MAFVVTSLQQTTTRQLSSLSKGLPQGGLVVVDLQCARTNSTIISSFRAAAHGLTGAGPPYVAVMAAGGKGIRVSGEKSFWGVGLFLLVGPGGGRMSFLPYI